jgi:antitoxin component of MazEF toxin-antitoxin module
MVGNRQGEKEMTGPKGIKWSAPVLIRKEGADLVVVVPEEVCKALDAGAGDVLNFTQLPDGAIEVWRVKKSGYASLDAMEGQASAAKKKAGKKKPGKTAGKRAAAAGEKKK